MPKRSATVLASGTANAAKLFVAALAFTSAYVGFSAYGNASSADRPSSPAMPVTLSAREVPITDEIIETAQPGVITMSVLAGGTAGCGKSYVARSLLVNPEPGQAMQYHWRLARWSPATRKWRTYLSEYKGTAAAVRPVKWRSGISGNPGWYRVELSVNGAEPVTSDRFQVSC